MKRVPVHAVLACAALLLAACQTTPMDQTSEALRTYQCGELRVETRSAGEQLLLRLPERDVRLLLVVSASGARYGDDQGNGFWSKGRERALLRLEQGPWLACQVSEGRSPWVAARDRGVAYRAVGQEPGWWLELGSGETPAMVVVLDYGQQRLQLPRTRAGE
ncbi:MAG TPA: MliC family protein, partial [Thioalkalivibrio sp.]|nr:MliC family protein [Thioalkalivibrio sp.]